MIYINEPKILDTIIQNVLKIKRKTPYHITIESREMRIYWKNHRCTCIELRNSYIDLVHSHDGSTYGRLVIISLNEKKCLSARINFDITNLKGTIFK